jgi:phytol kinase
MFICFFISLQKSIGDNETDIGHRRGPTSALRHYGDIPVYPANGLLRRLFAHLRKSVRPAQSLLILPDTKRFQKMDSNFFGLLLSFAFLFAVIAFAKLLMLSVPSISPEFIRKFIHIAVSNWWFILTTFLTNIWAILLGPVLFIIVNSLATFLDWAKFLGMSEKTRNFGLVYFPISLLVLAVFLHTKVVSAHICGMAFLVMGYGDGLAGLVGKRYGKRILTGSKTYVGSTVMFVISVCVIAGISMGYGLGWVECRDGWIVIVVSAMMATLFEAVTPWGLDNVTVPLGTAMVLWGMEKLIPTQLMSLS